MQDRFDPYQQWLGIPAAEQPADHYRLLGLPLFTNDRTAISRAAATRIAQVRLAEAGRQPELAERLIAELTLARQTLLDPPKKLTYDAILRGVRVSRAAAEQVPGGTRLATLPLAAGGTRAEKRHLSREIECGNQQPLQKAGNPGVRRLVAALGTTFCAAGRWPWDRLLKSGDKSPHSKGTQAPPTAEPAPGGTWVGRLRMTPNVVLFLGIGVVGTAAIVLGLSLSLGSRPRGARHNPLRSPDGLAAKGTAIPGSASTATPAQAARSSARPPRPEEPSPQTPRLAHAPGFPTAPAGKTPVVPASLAPNGMVQGESPPSPEVTARLTAARRAMFDRDLKTAGQDVDLALRAARSDGDRAEAERVGKLLHSLETFWRAAADGCRQLQTAEELEIGDTRVIVVGVDATGITIRAAGRNLDYTFQGLPRSLAVLAAERRLSHDSQAMHLHVGSFLAVDRRGDRQEARRRWEKAGADGQSLMPEISLAPPVETVEPSKQGTVQK